LTTLKIAALAPTPIAIVRIARIMNAGARRNARAA
jgi:hypothetical protein